MEEAPQKFNKRKEGLDAIPHGNVKIHHKGMVSPVDVQPHDGEGIMDHAKNLQVDWPTLVGHDCKHACNIDTTNLIEHRWTNLKSCILTFGNTISKFSCKLFQPTKYNVTQSGA